MSASVSVKEAARESDPLAERGLQSIHRIEYDDAMAVFITMRTARVCYRG